MHQLVLDQLEMPPVAKDRLAVAPPDVEMHHLMLRAIPRVTWGQQAPRHLIEVVDPVGAGILIRLYSADGGFAIYPVALHEALEEGSGVRRSRKVVACTSRVQRLLAIGRA
jgi:hypothetical protein